MKSLLRTVMIGGMTPSSFITDLTLSLARVGFGLIMAFGHGIGKFPPGEGFVGGVEALGFPTPTFFAWMASISEFFGGILLALGLLTRPAAFLIAGTMFVAAFVAHSNDPLFLADAGEDRRSKEMALLFLFAAVAYLGAGSGRFGIDRVLRGKA